MSLNANTPTLETKETKTQRELFIVVDQMPNTLEHFAKKLVQQKKDNSNRISQLEFCLTATLDDSKHYSYQAFLAYSEKEEIGILKSEIETLKEENSKLKQDINKTSDRNIKRRKGQSNVANRNRVNAKTLISTKYTI